MRLLAIVDNRQHAIEVPADVLNEAEEFFQRMDRDMDGGWRMGPEFVERPDARQRCQIAADRLLGALSSANETLAMLMAGYILKRMPAVRAVRIDTGGEPLNTELLAADRVERTGGATTPAPPPLPSRPLGRLEAMEQAAMDISRVYRVGRGFRFAEFDHARGHWVESALLDDEADANEQRMLAVKRRFDALLAGDTSTRSA
jgi:hypothetical protein